MRIVSVHLHPFAGIRDQTFEFEEDLHVFLGPNETGKSTVFQAIMHGLLTTTSLTARQVEDTMGSFFPATGGDVIRVDLELKDNSDQSVFISKTWKKGNRAGRAGLKLADGTEIADEEEVQRHIESLLPVTPATLRTILLADQSGLHHTMREMEQNGNIRKELGDVLRQDFMETGGVSVDRFQDLMNQRYDQYFKRWDRDQQYPENNRGIKNPFKVGLGKVVEAYYKKEQLRIDLNEARRHEDELDTLNEKLTCLIEQKGKKKEEFKKLGPLKEGIQQRQLKEQQLETAREKKERLLEISKKWPVHENTIETLEPKLKAKKEEIEKLGKELSQAQNKQKAEQLKQQIDKIEQLSEKVKDAQKELKETQKVEQEDLKNLRGLRSEIQNLKTHFEVAKLTVRIESDSDKTLSYTEVGGEQQEINAKSGAPFERTASGGFSLKANGLNIQVYSGDGDLEQIIGKLEVKEQEFSDYLKKLDVESIQDAESYAQLYQQKDNALKQVQGSFENELGDRDLGKLKEVYEAYGDLSKVRPVEEINNDLVSTRTELSRLEYGAKEAENIIKEWKEKYDSLDDVILKLADASSSVKQIEKDLEELPSLPEGYDSPENFITHVNSLDQSLQQLKDQISEKKQERTQLEAKAPESSSEELQKLLEEAEAEFERINKEAETLARVKEKAEGLIKSVDSDTYSGLESGFTKWLELMVGDRFSAVAMAKDIPSVFETSDSKPLTYNLLSHGTKDTVCLAWRFALCEKFLNNHQGFIILDDPMVDIDPERRKNVVEAIQQFSRQYQVILMTCHPDHAEELTGKDEVVTTG